MDQRRSASPKFYKNAAIVFFALGAVHKNPPHCLCGRREEMSAAIPVLVLLSIHKLYIRLMHQRRRL